MVGLHERNRQPCRAVEESSLENIGLEEVSDPVASHAPGRTAFAACVRFGRAPIAVTRHLAQKIVQRSIGIMCEAMLADTDRKIHDDFLMNLLVLVAALVAAKQAQHLVGLPRPVPDFAAPEKVPAADPITIASRSGEDGLDLGLELRRHSL